MFSKLNTKTLLVVLVVLLALFAAIEYTDTSDSSYSDEVIKVDTAAVNKIVFKSNKSSFKLIKENQKWFVQSDKNKADADKNKVKALLSRMSPLTPLRVAANSKKQWKKFGLDKDALQVDFYNGSRLLNTLYLGKVDYQAPATTDRQNPYSRGNQGIMIGYARAGKNKTVYVVDGYLKMSYAGDVNGFRKKSLIDLKRDLISHVSINSGGATFELTKKDLKWMADNQPADSANTAKYLNNITRLRGYEFVTDDVIKGKKPIAGVVINQGEAHEIKIDAYPVDSVSFALVSSVNHGNIIKDKNHRLLDKLIKEKSYFINKKQVKL